MLAADTDVLFFVCMMFGITLGLKLRFREMFLIVWAGIRGIDIHEMRFNFSITSAIALASNRLSLWNSESGYHPIQMSPSSSTI